MCFYACNHKKECVLHAEETSVCWRSVYEKQLLGPFEISWDFRNTGCLVVSSHRKHRPQTGMHIQTAPHLSHTYTHLNSVNDLVWLSLNWMISLKMNENWNELYIFFFFHQPQNALTVIRQTKNNTAHYNTKHSYLHPHQQECPPDNKSSVSDQGSCHLEVLILRQKSQSHMSALILLWSTWLGMTCHCLQEENVDCP